MNNEKSVVKINAGTGFFVSPQYIITCFHVVKSPEKGNIVNYIDSEGNGTRQAEIIDIQKEDDLILLEADTPSEYYFQLDAVAIFGRDIIVCGFPSDNTDYRSTRASVGEAVSDKKIQLHRANGVTVGYSGGPVCTVKEPDAAIGILKSIDDLDEYGRLVEESYMIPAAVVLKHWKQFVIEKKYTVYEKAQNDFVYQAQMSDFQDYGRYKDKLQDFIGRPDHLLWTAVIGEGGTGKSRLAYEFASEQNSTWYCKLVRQSDLQVNVLDQIYEEAGRDLLLLVDYAYTETGELGLWISNKRRGKQDGPRIRILLLQRQGKQEKQLPSWEEHLRAGHENDISLSAFPVILLEKPEKEIIFSIMKSYAQKFGRGMENDELQALYDVLFNIDKELTRPLFALFVTQAFLDKEREENGMNGADISNWNKEDTLRYFANREMDRIFNSEIDREYAKAFHFLQVLSTIVDGYSFSKDSTLPDLEDIEDFTGQMRELGRKLSNHGLVIRNKGTYFVPPIKPDLLGEAFVKQYLNEHCNDINTILTEAASHNPTQLSDFLIRLFTDFQSDEAFAVACCGEENQFEGDVSIGLILRPDAELVFELIDHHFQKSLFWMKQYALSLLKSIVIKKGDASIHIDQLKMISRLGVAAPVFLRPYVHGLANLIVHGSENTESYLDALKKIYETQPNNEEYAQLYFWSLRVALSEGRCSIDISYLKELYNNNKSNTEIIDMYSFSLNQIIWDYPDSITPYLWDLKHVYEENPTNEDVLSSYVLSLSRAFVDVVVNGKHDIGDIHAAIESCYEMNKENALISSLHEVESLWVLKNELKYIHEQVERIMNECTPIHKKKRSDL